MSDELARWKPAEDALLDAGVPLPLPHRSAWTILDPARPSWFITVQDGSGRYCAGLVAQAHPSRALPGHQLLRVERFGAAASADARAAALSALVDLARRNRRVLRVHVEVFSPDEQIRSEIVRPARETPPRRDGWTEFFARSWRALPSSAAPQPERLVCSAEDLAAEIARVEVTRAAAAAPSYAFHAVTALAKASAATVAATVVAAADSSPVRSRGQASGRSVHLVLEAAGRGARGPRLRRICHSALLENERPTRDGEPLELGELELVETVTTSEMWERARKAERRCFEFPFAMRTDGASGARSEEYLEGVIDLAFREGDGWVIIDYKTHSGATPTSRAVVRRTAASWRSTRRAGSVSPGSP